MKSILLILALCLVGCGRSDYEKAQGKIPGAPARMIEFTLSDGTRCVTAYEFGLTCDWRPRRLVRFEDLPITGPITGAWTTNQSGEKGSDGLPLPAR